MKLYPFQAHYPNVDLIASTDSFFGTVREDFNEYFNNGFFESSLEKAIYILEIRTGTKVHTGIIACLDVEDYAKGKIVKHEQTLASSEQAMLKLFLQRGAMVKPVLLCHPALKELDKEINKAKKKHEPFLEITIASGPNHYTLFQLKGKEGEAIMDLYKSMIPKLYIADGHHRLTTADKLLKLQGKTKGKDYSLILSALFPFDQLDILDYNRTVALPFHLKMGRFMAELSRFVDIQLMQRADKPKKKHDLTMFLQEDWYQLTWKPEVLKKYKKEPAILDAHLLDKEILEGILGIVDVRNDTRVEYVSGNLGPARVEEKARIDDHHVGFCMYPVQFTELVKVSDNKGTLPPKSTWFEPRMINGLIVKSY